MILFFVLKYEGCREVAFSVLFNASLQQLIALAFSSKSE